MIRSVVTGSVYHISDQFAIPVLLVERELTRFCAFYNLLLRGFKMKKITTRTGKTAPVSGQYKATGSKTEVTLVQSNLPWLTRHGIKEAIDEASMSLH